MDIVEKARIYATAAHAATGQRRKYTNEPYIVHPAEVVDLVKKTRGYTPQMLAAAWLHDVVEDTKVTEADLREEFDDSVAWMVRWLTDVSKPSDGNRAVRKAIDARHSGDAPPEVQTIKLADMISNTKSIIVHDHDFARVYLKEKRFLLLHMTGGDPMLRAQALEWIDKGWDILGLEEHTLNPAV
jgi:(p)ppGpp synthase/HD superfamily hydrolase